MVETHNLILSAINKTEKLKTVKTEIMLNESSERQIARAFCHSQIKSTLMHAI